MEEIGTHSARAQEENDFMEPGIKTLNLSINWREKEEEKRGICIHSAGSQFANHGLLGVSLMPTLGQYHRDANFKSIILLLPMSQA